MIVAIDGPAASGKGTVAKLLAEKLKLETIDTGAMYRAVTLYAIKNNLNNDEEIVKATKKLKIELKGNKVFLNGEDVTKEIRTPEVTERVSPVSAIYEVRIILIDLQRKIAKGKNIIMEGRDITTVVFPDADFKFYLDASLEERARRRLIDYKNQNKKMTIKQVEEEIRIRDKMDMEKDFGALKRTDDQIYIDSTNMSIEEVVEEMIKYIKGE